MLHSLNDNLIVTGTTSSTTLGGDLQVDGATNLDGTLTVTAGNATTLNDNLIVTGTTSSTTDRWRSTSGWCYKSGRNSNCDCW